MATVKSVMEVMKRLRPTFRNRHDKLAFAIHAAFESSGFTLIATGPHRSCRTGIWDDTDYYDEVGIEGWNKNGEYYTFVYMDPGPGPIWYKTLVKCLVMGDLLMVNVLAPASHLDLNVDDYVEDTQSSNYSEQFKNLQKLLKSFDRAILSGFFSPNVLRPKHRRKMLVSLVGVGYAGKTSFLDVCLRGFAYAMMEPTLGYNMGEVRSSDVQIKIWDLGGQPSLRRLWEKYCQAVHAIVYVVDAANPKELRISRSELHNLLSKPSLNGIPLLVLGNKIDKRSAISEEDLRDEMNLKSIAADREVGCLMISCEKKKNINSVIDWFVDHAHQPADEI